jgi:hypothetical protein
MAPPREYQWRTSREAACRMRDIVATHQMVLSKDEILAKRFIAIRLSDGGTDGAVYDSREDAIRHQLHETLCAYVQVPLERWNAETCDALLWYVRSRYDAGYRAAPDRQLMLPTRMEGLLP